MSALLQSNTIQLMFRINDELIRAWIKEFGDYFSEHAKPEANKHRKFTRQDAEVFATIKGMREQKLSFGDIHATLKSGQRKEIPIPEDVDLALVAESQSNMALAMQTHKLRQERDNLMLQLVEAEAKLNPTQQELERARGQLEELRRQIEENARQLMEAMKFSQQSYVQGFKDGIASKRPKDD